MQRIDCFDGHSFGTKHATKWYFAAKLRFCHGVIVCARNDCLCAKLQFEHEVTLRDEITVCIRSYASFTKWLFLHEVTLCWQSYAFDVWIFVLKRMSFFKLEKCFVWINFLWDKVFADTNCFCHICDEVTLFNGVTVSTQNYALFKKLVLVFEVTLGGRNETHGDERVAWYKANASYKKKVAFGSARFGWTGASDSERRSIQIALTLTHQRAHICPPL